jgi:DNA-binding protein
MAVTSMMPTCLIPFKNVSQIGAIPTLPQTPQLKTSMIFLDTMENSNSKKPRESQKPAIRIIASHNSNQPEIRINATKENKINATDTIAAIKSLFAPTISSMDIQMQNAATLAIQKE